MIQAAIQVLKNNSAFATAIGNNKAGTKPKIYPVIAEQGEEPPYAVLYMTGATEIDKGCTDEITFNIVICSKPDTVGAYINNDTLASLARTALEAHAGLESVSGYTLNFQRVDMKDGYDAAQNLLQRICTYTSDINR